MFRKIARFAAFLFVLTAFAVPSSQARADDDVLDITTGTDPKPPDPNPHYTSGMMTVNIMTLLQVIGLA